MRKTFGLEVAEIAQELNIPKATVEAVLRARIKHQIEELKQGNSVTVENLFTIKVITDSVTGEKMLRGSVSQNLKRIIAEDRTARMAR